jgi:hypothetical protein
MGHRGARDTLLSEHQYLHKLVRHQVVGQLLQFVVHVASNLGGKQRLMLL